MKMNCPNDSIYRIWTCFSQNRDAYLDALKEAKEEGEFYFKHFEDLSIMIHLNATQIIFLPSIGPERLFILTEYTNLRGIKFYKRTEENARGKEKERDHSPGAYALFDFLAQIKENVVQESQFCVGVISLHTL